MLGVKRKKQKFEIKFTQNSYNSFKRLIILHPTWLQENKSLIK